MKHTCIKCAEERTGEEYPLVKIFRRVKYLSPKIKNPKNRSVPQPRYKNRKEYCRKKNKQCRQRRWKKRPPRCHMVKYIHTSHIPRFTQWLLMKKRGWDTRTITNNKRHFPSRTYARQSDWEKNKSGTKQKRAIHDLIIPNKRKTHNEICASKRNGIKFI